MFFYPPTCGACKGAMIYTPTGWACQCGAVGSNEGPAPSKPETKCTCGAGVVGSSGHSSWCDTIAPSKV